jgi:hypothetical protein
MSLFSKLVSLPPFKKMFNGKEEVHLKVLEQGISLLRLSTFYTLQRKLAPEVGPDSANALAVAVVSVMILESTSDDRFSAFYRSKRDEIARQAQEAHKHEEISGPSGCASYLYAAEILHAGMVKGAQVPDATKQWKSAKALQEQAENLGIYLPGREEICGSNDRGEFIDAIHSFAKAFYYSNTWTGTSPVLTNLPFPSIPFDYQFLSKMLLDNSRETEAPEAAPVDEAGDDLPAVYRLRANP